MLRVIKKAIACATLMSASFLMMSMTAHAASPSDSEKLNDWCSGFDTEKNQESCDSAGRSFLSAENAKPKEKNDDWATAQYRKDIHALKFLAVVCHSSGDDDQETGCLMKNLKELALASPSIQKAKDLAANVCLKGFHGDAFLKDRGKCLKFEINKLAGVTQQLESDPSRKIPGFTKEDFQDPYKKYLIVAYREGCTRSENPYARKACFAEGIQLMSAYFGTWTSDQAEKCAKAEKTRREELNHKKGMSKQKIELEATLKFGSCYANDLSERISRYEDAAKAEAEAKAETKAEAEPKSEEEAQHTTLSGPVFDKILVPVEEPKSEPQAAPQDPQAAPAQDTGIHGWGVEDIHAPAPAAQ